MFQTNDTESGTTDDNFKFECVASDSTSNLAFPLIFFVASVLGIVVVYGIIWLQRRKRKQRQFYSLNLSSTAELKSVKIQEMLLSGIGIQNKIMDGRDMSSEINVT